MRILPALALVLSISATAYGQKDPYEEDTRTLITAGKLENKTYSNSHAGFVVRMPQTPCQPAPDTPVNEGKGSATLLACVHDVKGGGAYTFSIITDSWTRYHLVDIGQYVRGLRRLGEHVPGHPGQLDPNTKVIEPETPRKWAGLDFQELIMSIIRSDRLYYSGVTCTHLKDYVLCFKAEAATPVLVHALLMLEGKLEITATPLVHPRRKK